MTCGEIPVGAQSNSWGPESHKRSFDFQCAHWERVNFPTGAESRTCDKINHPFSTFHTNRSRVIKKQTTETSRCVGCNKASGFLQRFKKRNLSKRQQNRVLTVFLFTHLSKTLCPVQFLLYYHLICALHTF